VCYQHSVIGANMYPK